jgi:hypothetical protein
MTHEKPFLNSDFLVGPKTLTLIQYAINLGQIQQYGNQILITPDCNPHESSIKHEDLFIVKSYRDKYSFVRNHIK